MAALAWSANAVLLRAWPYNALLADFDELASCAERRNWLSLGSSKRMALVHDAKG